MFKGHHLSSPHLQSACSGPALLYWQTGYILKFVESGCVRICKQHMNSLHISNSDLQGRMCLFNWCRCDRTDDASPSIAPQWWLKDSRELRITKRNVSTVTKDKKCEGPNTSHGNSYLLPSDNLAITLPRVRRERLIKVPSLNLTLVHSTPVAETLSDPARSTKF